MRFLRRRKKETLQTALMCVLSQRDEQLNMAIELLKKVAAKPQGPYCQMARQTLHRIYGRK